MILAETKNFLQSLKKRFLEANEENKDFNNLYSQYKRTKKSLDSEKNTIFAENLEKEIKNLKKNIMNKIDEAIVNSPIKVSQKSKREMTEIKDLIEEKDALEKEKIRNLIEHKEEVIERLEEKIVKKDRENTDPNVKGKGEMEEKLYKLKVKLSKKDEKIEELQ